MAIFDMTNLNLVDLQVAEDTVWRAHLLLSPQDNLSLWFQPFPRSLFSAFSFPSIYFFFCERRNLELGAGWC